MPASKQYTQEFMESALYHDIQGILDTRIDSLTAVLLEEVNDMVNVARLQGAIAEAKVLKTILATLDSEMEPETEEGKDGC